MTVRGQAIHRPDNLPGGASMSTRSRSPSRRAADTSDTYSWASFSYFLESVLLLAATVARIAGMGLDGGSRLPLRHAKTSVVEELGTL